MEGEAVTMALTLGHYEWPNRPNAHAAGLETWRRTMARSGHFAARKEGIFVRHRWSFVWPGSLHMHHDGFLSERWQMMKMWPAVCRAHRGVRLESHTHTQVDISKLRSTFYYSFLDLQRTSLEFSRSLLSYEQYTVTESLWFIYNCRCSIAWETGCYSNLPYDVVWSSSSLTFTYS